AAGAAQATSNPQATPSAADAAAAARAEFAAPAAEAHELTVERANSDVMVDVIKSLGIEYVAANPGSSFRGLHESLINYGGNKSPELLTCLHEETSVAMAAGYARVTGRPMAVMLHSTVGLQHGSMSIYHAFADQVPVLMFMGASLDAATRRPYIEWMHSVQDGAALVRDFTKWDDQPVSMQHFAESTVRAVKLATTAPMGPVLISVDTDLQEVPFRAANFSIPPLSPASQPVGDLAAVRQIAQALAQASAPVILAHRYARTQGAMARLIELAELLQIPVVDSGDRFNFPTDHPLNHSRRMRPLIAQADVVLALEPVDLWGALNKLQDQNERRTSRLAKADVKVFTIGVQDNATKANYQTFQRYVGATLAVDGDAEATLPSLIEEARRAMTSASRAAAAERGAALKETFQALRERDRQEARYGWDASPISTARLSSEIWQAIKNEDWVLASHTFFQSGWPQRLWDINRPHQYVGGLGAGGLGSNIGTATGAALAHRGSGRVVVNIQGDGDLLYAPGALWTAAHHRIPLLTVVHNNRAYHQEVMHIQRIANRRQRGIDRAHIGTAIDGPAVDFAKLAQSMGMWAAGPIENPSALPAALRRAVAIVKQGQPALVEVVSQPR
ncbi:MAG: alsS, partial [Alphaproteobacteria bacterium]|nr:alsS [Alphaproteobacteria bacterium]